MVYQFIGMKSINKGDGNEWEKVEMSWDLFLGMSRQDKHIITTLIGLILLFIKLIYFIIIF